MALAWTDRLTKAQHDQMDAALNIFEGHRDLDTLYEDLVKSGMTSEEADEYCNLMTGDETLD